MSDTGLSGQQVVVTRPPAQAAALAQRLRDAGAGVRLLPLVDIEHPLTADDCLAALEALAHADLWIFTSINAVVALGGRTPARVAPRIAAIGPATAARLAELGLRAWVPAAGSRSEDLLADPQLGEVAGTTIVIAGGEGGRGLLAETLQARGATVHPLSVYRRLPLQPDAETLAAALTGATAIHFTSATAMDQFQALQPEGAFGPDWVVISPRLARHARTLGYPREPVLTAGPGDDDLVAALRALSTTADAMTDPASDAEAATPPDAPAAATPAAAPATPAAPRRSGGLGWAALALVLLALLLVAGGWGYQRLQQQQARVEALLTDVAAARDRLDALADDQTDLARSTRRGAEQLALFDERLGRYDETLGTLHEQVSGGQERAQLAAIEHLLLIANDRLQLAHDVPSAETALALADARLARLSDPRLFGVREAIAAERAALAALPVPDRAGIALQLAGWIQQVPSLPLKARVPSAFEATPLAPEPPPPVAADAPWYQRSWGRLQALAGQLFVVRKDPGQAARLLPVEEEALIYGLLRLQLENARSAFLQGDGESFAALLSAARGWLAQYFALDQPAVRALDAGLRDLQDVPLSVSPPDIAGSLQRLRAQLEPAPR